MKARNVRVKDMITPITLDKERNLLFDLNAFAELESEYGGIQEGLETIANGSLKGLRFLLWAGLMHEDPALTQRDVGAMITLADFEELGKVLEEAMSKSMPEGAVEEAKAQVEKNVAVVGSGKS